MKEIILLGAGGHAAVILDILKAQSDYKETFIIKGLLDDSDKTEWMGFSILGKISEAPSFHNEQTEFIIAIGNNAVRKKIQENSLELTFTTALHPTAIIGTNVRMEAGTVVMPRAVINANTQIGKHVIINTGVIVEHDNIIEDYVHLSPNATLCGAVKINKLAHIGANATIIPGKSVGFNTTIGAGSTIIHDIPSNSIAVGTPATVIKQK